MKLIKKGRSYIKEPNKYKIIIFNTMQNEKYYEIPNDYDYYSCKKAILSRMELKKHLGRYRYEKISKNLGDKV